MKIRLKQDVAVEKKHGLTEGRVFDVLGTEHEIVSVRGDAGELVWVRDHEYAEVEEVEDLITSECHCGGDVDVREPGDVLDGSTLYDFHCIACGATVRIWVAAGTKLRVILDEKYREGDRPMKHEHARNIAAIIALVDAARELADLVDAAVAGTYVCDSFTSQPVRQALAIVDREVHEVMDGGPKWNHTLDLWPSRTVINLVDPNPAEYWIEDIAWGLSWEMRFANHIPKFYSVAEHCVHAAEIALALFEVGPSIGDLARRCLLHDASEGVGWRDLPSPIKALLPEYKRYEKIHQRAIYERFGLAREDAILDSKVKAIDNHLYELEHSELRLGVPLAGLELQCWSPEQAREKFLEMFHNLFPQRVW